MSSFQEYYYKNVGNRIRMLRIQHGLTQEQLSELLLKNDKYIGHIERCERKISQKILIQILELFKISPSDFFNFEKYNFTVD